MVCFYHGIKCPYPIACRFAPGNLVGGGGSSYTRPASTYIPSPSHAMYRGPTSSSASVPGLREKKWTVIDTNRILCQLASVAAVIAGFVAPFFVYPLIGTGLFFGGIAAFIVSTIYIRNPTNGS